MSVKGHKPHVLFRAVPNRSTYCPLPSALILILHVLSPRVPSAGNRTIVVATFFSLFPSGCFYSYAWLEGECVLSEVE